MKIIIIMITVFVAASIMSCQNYTKETQQTEQVQKVEKIDDTEKIEKVFGKFKSLYNQLLEFKDKDNFKKFGFGQGSPYNKWLKEVEQLENNADSKLLLQKGFVAGDLKSLGMEYVGSKGQKTEVTNYFNNIFLEAINPKPVE
jgi:hypothetical protein